ncbi:MAG: GPR endopeptidase [Clostridia bacterium]|nr:GPR endopeptidase [Clostridia bacterium]
MQKIRTDLAIEAHEMCESEKAEENHFEGIDVSKYGMGDVFVTKISVKNEKGSSILGKPVGNYITLEIPNLKYSDEAYQSACKEIASEIKKLTKITNGTKTLVVGLGNKAITPDALGPKTVSYLVVTNHIKEGNDFLGENFSRVCALTPGVLGTTGIETIDIIKGVVEKAKPNLVIAVDALASRSMDRISNTVQISDTGINPGSGVENKREGINEEALGVKVIAIGVPTVVDCATVASDSIDAVFTEKDINGIEKEKIYSCLSQNVGNMMVTPKDIDAVIEKASKTVANGINLALNKDLTLAEIESYISY